MVIDYYSIKQKIPILEYFEVKSGQKLRKKGRYYFAKCPFHSEKTPSFSITESPAIFYCWGCGRSGDVLDLAEWFGDEIKLDDYVIKETPKIKLKPQVEEFVNPTPLPTELLWSLRENLWKDNDAKWARTTLLNRGISESTMRSEFIGVTWTKGGRITIPVTNWDNHSLNIFDIRAYKPEVEDKIIPLFAGQAGKLPFIPLTCRHLIKPNEIIWIVEGELDAILMSQYTGVVSCTCGVHCLPSVWSTKGWRNLINEASDIIIALDNDEAGQSVTETLINDSLFGFDGLLWKVKWPHDTMRGEDVTSYLQNHTFRDLEELVIAA